MSASLSRYLKDFSAPKIEITRMPPKYFPNLEADFPAEDRSVQRPAMPEIDVDAERREAFAQGRAEAAAELAFEHQREIAELKARHAEELDAVKHRLAEDTASKLAAGFSQITERLALALGDQAARVLAPVMEEALIKRAVEDLAAMIRQGIGAGEGLTITVKGSPVLFEALKQHLDDDTLVFRHVVADDIDLTVELGEAVLVTRMAAWSETVRKVLA
ncbi:hypothetical protein [Sinorhizobium americanum]|uniref:Uncharacterized protein n=1 Tax=Sinorhizobium americanum TaxID=194963 RepID=A0A1L3LJ11_9HYPH|nr:hypothetical protein [Sinorhizobium americanum]APG90003.1 hypothetical protein SAMCFNEI73_Ch0678 [Sinorhizobium americanum]OAP42403.1 hypothetical protein ATC00_27715 [Sinorhizobium americanum]TCN36459.1 hypothetical protein EV184_101451 [Sinorhizobium americanum]